MVAKAKELILKGKKAQWIARRRYVARRRRWSAPKVTAARRRSVLSSRRRQLVERRRRSTAALESAVTKATLKVYKFGGPASKLTVKAISCGWKRPIITYANAAKLAIPVTAMGIRWAESLVSMEEGESANLGSEDVAQRGYWKRDSQAQPEAKKLPVVSKQQGLAPENDDKKAPRSRLKEAETSQTGWRRKKKIRVTPKATKYNRRRRAPVKRPPPRIIPRPIPYTPSRRRYADRRRRFPTPKKTPKKPPTTSAPNPTVRRRRFVGKTAGSAFVPDGKNKWVKIKLSPNIVGVMRATDKMCFEISGGGPVQPVILGSEKSTNKPQLILNIKGQGGARRRRCSAVVALQALEATKKKKASKKPKQGKVRI